jgi:Ca2+:H+ antiporter
MARGLAARRGFVKAKWLNVLLIAIPLAFAAAYLNGQGQYVGKLYYWIFGLALVAVIPLATIIGQLTDRLSELYGDKVGGLLGASFGNAPELAIGILLLVQARTNAQHPATVQLDFDVIRGLMIGSVINNILFVLGSSIFFAALRNGRMTFSSQSAAGFASMLAIAVVGLALPTLATSLAEHASVDAEINVSIPFGIILILSYVSYLAATVFEVGARAKPKDQAAGGKEGKAEMPSAAEGLPLLADDPSHQTLIEKEIEREEAAGDADKLRRRAYRKAHPREVGLAVGGLALVTVFTVAIAWLLVSVTDNVIVDSPYLTPVSVGLVLFPLVCNLGEQAGSVMAAWRNRMEAAMSVAAGSSVQVALFVTPVLVLLSFPISGFVPGLILTLIFKPLELIVLGLVAFVYALVSLDGETTWLEGLQLLAFYAMVVAVAFALPG